MERVALAFSGGLDTTVCVRLLQEEYGYDEVIGVTVDVGQPEAEFEEAAATAASTRCRPTPATRGTRWGRRSRGR